MANRAVIFGVEAQEVTPWERGFLRDSDPWGFILFARNIDNPDQVRRLTAELREVVGRNAPILIDQEGGRVQRMRRPHWREYLPALDQMRRAHYPERAQYLRNRLIAAELLDVGIDVNCAPLADLVEEGTHPVLLNRLYGSDISTVIAAARACANGLMKGGVLPILKHIPGYGRAKVDSHHNLPRVSVSLSELHQRDFRPFRALRDIPIGMTAHIVFDAVDPDQPATTSTPMMKVIRNSIGFDGLLITDDLSMQALSGTLAERATAAIAAGCDVALHCNGKRLDMEEVAGATTFMTPVAQARADSALALRCVPNPDDFGALVAEFTAEFPDSA